MREMGYGRLIWEGFQRAGAINHVSGRQQTKVTDTDLELTQKAARGSHDPTSYVVFEAAMIGYEVILVILVPATCRIGTPLPGFKSHSRKQTW